jgi:hypothetical protein
MMASTKEKVEVAIMAAIRVLGSEIHLLVENERESHFIRFPLSRGWKGGEGHLKSVNMSFIE